MKDQEISERRKGERRKDIESARVHIGMERRLGERRRGREMPYWDGKGFRTPISNR